MNRLISCIVKDKHALQVMDLLEGFAIEPPAMTKAQPRLNNESTPTMPEGGKRYLQSHNGASKHLDDFVANARQAGLKQITGKQLVKHMEMGGFNKYSYGYRLNQLIKDKSVKRTRQAGVYEITNG